VESLFPLVTEKGTLLRIMTGREVEDEIIRLQKLSVPSPVAEVVEEAAQAFADGREMEAEALVEKISALLRRPQVAS
jgi:hypothetical protein